MLLIHASSPRATRLATVTRLLTVAANLAPLTLETGVEALCGSAAGRVLRAIAVRGRLGGTIHGFSLDPLD